MALDTVQDISAITELVFTGLKMTGISLLTVCSVLGTDHYFRDYVDKEKRMKDTVTQWRAVLSCLNEKQKGQIGANAVVEMNELLNQLDCRLGVLAIKLRRSSLWSRTMGKDANDIKKLECLVKQTDDDLRTRTESVLFPAEAACEPTPPGAARLQSSLSVIVDIERDAHDNLNLSPPTAALPHAQFAVPAPAASVPGRRLQVARSMTHPHLEFPEDPPRNSGHTSKLT